MASGSFWQALLSQKFRVYQLEESVYIQSSKTANSPEKYAKFICDAIRPGDVPEALHRLYIEAVYGLDKDVKSRIKNRIYLIGRHVWYVIYFQ